MKLNRLLAMVHRDFLIIRRLKWKIVDMLYMPVTTVIIWGLFSIYAKEFAAEAGFVLLVVNVFWTFAQLSQTSTNQGMMEDVWSGSLKQLFFSGITEFEYLLSRVISTMIVSTLVAGLMFTMAFYFGFTMIATHLPVFVGFLIITLIASTALAVIVASIIFVMGREYGFLSWAFIQIFVLLSAPFFPVETFPSFLQGISQVMPYTNVFSGMRVLIETGTLQSSYLINGLLVAVGYLLVSLPLYRLSFLRAKRTGQLVRMA